jgi:hypothetical protein
MNQRLTNEITSVLSKAQIVENLARKKFLGAFILGLIKSKKVQFCEIAHHLNEDAKLVSNEVRIQDFFREVEIDYKQVAILLISLLPPKKKVRICIDRTEWDFGKTQVNILMIVVGCGDFQIPLYWELLDNNSGNSSTKDRIALLNLCLLVLDKERIGYIVGDREFVGHSWVKYLKDNSIPFIMRLPKHHLLTRPDGLAVKIEELDLSVDRVLILKDYLVDGVVADVWVKRLETGDFLFLLGTVNADYMGQLYRKRWTIETVFQSFKGRGFDLESTHLQSICKIKKLIALVSITYSLCRNLGIYYHEKVQKIKTKNHGYKTVSFVRKGIDLIRQHFRGSKIQDSDMERTLIILLRWIQRQIAHYQPLKKAG